MKIKKMSKELMATQMNPLPGSDYNLNSPYNITPLITHQGHENKGNDHQLKKLLMIVSPLLANISMHILPSVLYTFPKVLTRRICLTTKKMRSKSLTKITPALQATSKCE